MKLRNKTLLLFAPLTTIMACTGIFLDSLYWRPSANQSISDVSFAGWPAPIIFALSLSAISITFIIFVLAFRQYGNKLLTIAAVAGIALTAAGWVQYLFKNRVSSTIHSGGMLLAIVCYELIIWQTGRHRPPTVARLSHTTFWLVAASAIFSVFDVGLIHFHIADFELLTFGLLQLWGLGLAWLLE